MRVYRALLTPHDFFFYVSRELRVGGPEPYIANTALNYALNRVEGVHRNASGSRPFYEEDRRLFRVYATPASIYWGGAALADGVVRRDPRWPSDLVRITYNSVMEGNVVFMEAKKIAVPKLGYYMKYPPLTSFTFFVISGSDEPLPRVVRIGKKYPPARVHYEELRFTRRSGRFEPSHPVSVLDLPSDTRVVEGRIIYMAPTSLLVESVLEGEYIEAWLGRNRYRIAMPDRRRYPGVFSA